MTEGEICIIAPFTRHNVLVENDSLIISIMVRTTTFDGIFGCFLSQNDLLAMFFKNTLYETEQSNYILFHTENTESVKKMVQTIVRECHGKEKYGNVCCNSTLQLLFCMLLRRYSDTVLYYGYDKENASEIDFSLILEYIQQHYQTVTLKSLADFFHYSEAYLSKLIKKNLKQNFTTVVQGLKMQKALEYLADRELSIEQIAEKIGYDSVDYFSRNFKRHFKTPPSVYRKLMLEDEPGILL